MLEESLRDPDDRRPILRDELGGLKRSASSGLAPSVTSTTVMTERQGDDGVTRLMNGHGHGVDGEGRVAGGDRNSDRSGERLATTPAPPPRSRMGDGRHTRGGPV